MSLANYPGQWIEQAVCASIGPSLFYPEGQGARSAPAKRICKTCPVQADCLEYALDNHEGYGIFGGYSQRERAAIVKAGTRDTVVAELRETA